MERYTHKPFRTPENFIMTSLRDLHLHILLHARTHSGRFGNRQMRRWCRADDVHALAVDFIRRSPRSASIDYNRIAIAACQDLVRLKLLSMDETCGYRTFSKRSGCLVYLHTGSPKTQGVRFTSGLRWT